MKILWRLLIIFVGIYLLYKFLDNGILLSFAEELREEEKVIPWNATDWDKRYIYHPHGDLLFALDMTCFALWWGAFVLVTIWK